MAEAKAEKDKVIRSVLRHDEEKEKEDTQNTKSAT